ncbi:MAG: tRNA pseudouridine(55) synthase TruB [Firmicutes bacterium]|nr:tRNA pseudouridine(55) synthase TruB [Bacillota bacterium]
MTVNGVLPVVKPRGMTSHDVVAHIRRTFRIGRVGHTGTLDPDATGVLVILLGKATRLMQFMVTLPKTYLAEIVLGITTDTLDASGEVLSKTHEAKVSKERFLEALSHFQGEIWQVPPMVSAVHHKGRRLYELAREGIETPREPRRVHIYTLTVQAWPNHEVLTFGDKVSVLIECSSGTYVRQLAADIGERLSCGAHIGSLFRTKVGDFDIDSCYTLEELEEADGDGSFPDKVLPVSAGLSHLPTVTLTEDERDAKRRLSCGTKVDAKDLLQEVKGKETEQLKDSGFINVLSSSGDVICVAKREIIEGEVYLQPIVVFA